MNTESPVKKPGSRLRSNIVRGLAVLFPVYLTYLMMSFLIRSCAKPLSPLFRWIALKTHLGMAGVDHPRWILDSIIMVTSLVVTLALVIGVGAIAQRVIGRKLFHLLESILDRVPLIRTIYKTFREITRIMTGEATQAYKKVVYVTLPGELGMVLGFTTGKISINNSEEFHTVFVPTVPNITTGFLLLLKPDQFKETDLTPEEGLRIIISAGILNK